MDLKSRFFQIKMDERDRHKTGFSTEDNHYEYIRMTMGLKNAPVINFKEVLKGLIGKICFVYLDDIVVFGYDLENHVENFKTVFKRLIDAKLKMQLDKSEFLKKETEFLGHMSS